MKITKSQADEAAPKKNHETAQTIFGISVTILKIICWYGLIFDGLKDNLLISGYILKTEPERIMTTIDTLLPENFTIPPLVAIISINFFLIVCIMMRKFSYEYCTWIEGKAGNFLKFVDNCGLSVCYYNVTIIAFNALFCIQARNFVKNVGPKICGSYSRAGYNDELTVIQNIMYSC